MNHVIQLTFEIMFKPTMVVINCKHYKTYNGQVNASFGSKGIEKIISEQK